MPLSDLGPKRRRRMVSMSLLIGVSLLPLTGTADIGESQGVDRVSGLLEKADGVASCGRSWQTTEKESYARWRE